MPRRPKVPDLINEITAANFIIAWAVGIPSIIALTIIAIVDLRNQK